MDSPSFATHAPSTLSDREDEAGVASGTVPRTGEACREDAVLVAGLGNPIAADFAAYAGRGSRDHVVLVGDAKIRALVEPPVRPLVPDGTLRTAPDVRGELGLASSLILFIPPRLTDEDRRAAIGLAELARRCRIRFLGVVSTFRVHLDDPEAEAAEEYVLSLFRPGDPEARVVVFRPGHVISPHSPIGGLLRRFAWLYPLIPGRLRTCVIEGDELFAAIESERKEGAHRDGSGDLETEARIDPRARAPRVGPSAAIGGPTRSWARTSPGVNGYSETA